MTAQPGTPKLPHTDQIPKLTATQPLNAPSHKSDDMTADPTRICWTQLLRKNPPDSAVPLPPLQRSPSAFPVDKLFS